MDVSTILVVLHITHWAQAWGNHSQINNTCPNWFCRWNWE